MLGEAADIKVDGVPAEALATAIVQRGGHVHISFTVKRSNRRQTLHAPVGGGYTAWAPASGRVA